MDQDKKYGLPTLKKYPMPDADHVRSAIKFFNYVDSRHEKELAGEILARMKEYGISFTDLNVGDENRFKKYLPKNELKHHGILGMKWGIRRYQNPDGSLTSEGKARYIDSPSNNHMSGHTSFKSKNGDTITLERIPETPIAKVLSKISPNVKENVRNNSNMLIKVNGKRVGDLELYQKGKKELNVVWVGVDDKHRGKGYASAVMKNVTDYAREAGNEKVTLEVPGISPDARHIYEKRGFKAVKQLTTAKDDPAWGGLTAMELDLTQACQSDSYQNGKTICNTLLK